MSSEKNLKLIRLPVVLDLTGLSKTALYEAISSGNFPKNLKISARSSAWVQSEVQDWVREKMEKRTHAGGQK